ncbi:MAG: hypothetical protein ACM3UY_07825 [Methanocella sp.]
MTQNTQQADQQPTDEAQARRALSTVNPDCGFHFYTAIGDYTGITATSLQDLTDKLSQVPLASVRFHYERGDFQRWIRTLFCDPKLAEELATIKPYFSDEALRKEIITKITEHIAHLKATMKES